MANARFTRRQLASAVSFALVFALLFASAERLLFNETFFSPVWTRLRQDKKAPQVLIMGNSHAFCSFLPEIINESLGLDSAVLGTSGQNSLSVADGFEAVVKVDPPEIAVIEVNPFLMDVDAMAAYHKASALNYINGMPGLFQRVKSTWNQLGFENIPQGAFQLLRADLMWTRWNSNAEIVFSADGSAPLGWHAQGAYDARIAQDEAIDYHAHSTPSEIEARNEKAFRKVLSLAQKYGVQVVLVKTPLVAATQGAVDGIAGLAQIADEYGDTILGLKDFHTEIFNMGLESRDFYDNGHLSHSGAAKFSIAFTRWLASLMGTEADFAHAFAYAGESVQQLDNGGWRYTMNALGKEVEYRFSVVSDEEETVIRDWSCDNYVDLDIPDAEQLYVTMRCGDQMIRQAFMTANSYVHR